MDVRVVRAREGTRYPRRNPAKVIEGRWNRVVVALRKIVVTVTDQQNTMAMRVAPLLQPSRQLRGSMMMIPYAALLLVSACADSQRQ